MTELELELTKLQEQLSYNQDELTEKKEALDNYEIDEDDKVGEFDNMLDESYPEFFGHSPSNALKRVDPIMYNQELSNYVDSLEVSDEQGYKEIEGEISDLESEIYDLEQEIEELEAEIEGAGDEQ